MIQMAKQPKQIHSSLTALFVSDLKRSQAYYRDVLGFDVTDWWAERGGLQGLALKLLQAPDASAVTPNPPEIGSTRAFDVYAYVENWTELDGLYDEFVTKGAVISGEPVVYPDGGPWKEFIVQDPDGYNIAFGGVDGRPAGVPKSPIRAQIDSAILWVRDLPAAVDRYSRFLGLAVRDQDRYGHLYVFRLENGTGLMLDSNGMEHIPVPESGPPLFKLDTSDIDAAHRHALDLGFEVVFGIARYPNASFFNVRDPDGNILTVCQEH
jgi:catechol 2,3-dioxygenase-like lactoylglutathione lyase family enzyme